MLGMHGTYEANMAMHDCDLMINIGARFDDRITGRIDAFSPGSTKIHVDIDPSSINKNVRIDLPIVGDCGLVLEEMVRIWRQQDQRAAHRGDRAVVGGRSTNGAARTRSASRTPTPRSSRSTPSSASMQATRDRDVYITTEVGQHQMWAAQHFHFEIAQPLDDLGWPRHHGLRPAGGGRRAGGASRCAGHRHCRRSLSVQMTMQEMSTAVQYRLPIKIFILNNERMGMVRQWQDLLHGGRYAHSYSESLPDFVKLAEAYGAKGIKCDDPAKLDAAIAEMLDYDGPVLFDCLVEKHENCLPMIPSGKPHNEMILPDFEDDIGAVIDAKGRQLV